MGIFMLICTLLYSIGFVIDFYGMIISYKTDKDDIFRSYFYCMPFQLMILLGLILSTIFLW